MAEPIAERYRRLVQGLDATGTAGVSRGHVAELVTLLDLAGALSGDLSGDQLLDAVLLSAMAGVRATRGAMFVPGNAGRDVLRVSREVLPTAPRELDVSLPGVETWDRSHAGLARWLEAAGLELLCPVLRGGRRVAIVGIGARDGGGSFSAEERALLESIAAFAATPIDHALIQEELREVNRRLALRVFQLGNLFDISRALTATPDEEAVKSLTVASLMGHLVVSRCALYLEGPGGLALAHERGVQATAGRAPLPARELASTRAALRAPMLTSALPEGELRAQLVAKRLTRLVPLQAGGGMAGFVALGERPSGVAFAEEDVEFVSMLGRQAMAALENARLQRVQIEKLRQDRELQIAREIQQSLFPARTPLIGGHAVAGASRPCYEVGGDYFDVIPLGEDRFGLVIADVSGKGVPASILMASIHASLRALAGASSPAETVARLHGYLFASTQASKFATLFYGELNANTRRLSYVNGGHVPPFVLHLDGSLTKLETGGPAVGLIEGASYEQGAVDLVAGDRLVMVTDGITEARSLADEEFGEARVIAAVQPGEAVRPDQAIEGLFASVRAWSGPTGTVDDLTALIVDVDVSPEHG